MKTLFIDTHLNDIHVLIMDEKDIYSEEHVVGIKQNSTLLMPTVKKVCDKSSYDEIIVVNGPGSFTGVRLGVTVAKTLAYTKNVPIKMISYFDCMYASSDCQPMAYSIFDGNGYYVKNYILKIAPTYLNTPDYEQYKDEYSCIESGSISVDYNKICEYAKNIPYTNAHAVNPVYIKKIGVENA